MQLNGGWRRVFSFCSFTDPLNHTGMVVNRDIERASWLRIFQRDVAENGNSVTYLTVRERVRGLDLLVSDLTE